MARLFNGTTDQISLGSLNLPAQGSLSAWVNLTSPLGGSTYQGIVIHIVAGAQLSIYFKTAPSAQFAYYVVTAGGTIGQDPGSVTVTVGIWYHVACTYDSVNGLKTFANGVSDGTQAANGAIPTSSAPVGIGYDPGNAGRNIRATIADPTEWNVVLTAAEIAALAKGARPSTIRPNNLLFFPPLDGLQSPEPDLSGNARNGTLTGTTKAFGPPTTLLTPRWSQFLPPPPAAFTLMPQIVT